MKVRIGYGLGTSAGAHGERFRSMVDALEELGFDSLWLSERVTGEAVDPLVGLAVAAGRTERLKLGTSVLVLPGRNPALCAKQLASLDALSGGRLLPAFGLGAPDAAEHQAFGVAREERAKWFDEALPLIRRLWAGGSVDHDGPRFQLRAIEVRPRPLQDPLEVWLGGAAPSELRRVGRLGDGWLPSFTTPHDAAAGRKVVEDAAARAGRAIDPEHWGALVVYLRSKLPDRLAALVDRRRPGTDPMRVFPVGLPALRELLEEFVANGFSKFVLLPGEEPADWRDELEEVAREVLPMQTGKAAAAG